MLFMNCIILAYCWWSRPKFWSVAFINVIGGHRQVFANNSRLKKRYRHGLVSLCSFCQDASTDMLRNLLVSTCDLTWPWAEFRYWPDHSRPPSTRFDAPWREKNDGGRMRPLAYLVRKFFKHFYQNALFWCFFLPPVSKPMVLPTDSMLAK